ncbi:phage holin family protein [Zobellia nedashkovskayae]|uniref:phage holin family protein n=1 Tax=Zobellia nedashkovskayae TaxID=2779510 RepID=UPI00188D0D8E|nr:phage holin family protein [Zobellia nedashkovskayae]
MAFESLKKDLVDVDTDMRSYLETSEEYYKLKVFKVLMGIVTAITQSLFIGAVVFLALFMLSIGASIALNEAMGNFYSGFLIVGAFYILVAICSYVFRNVLHRPLLQNFSKHYFNRP